MRYSFLFIVFCFALVFFSPVWAGTFTIDSISSDSKMLQVTIEADSDFQSRHLFAHAFYFDAQGKPLTSYLEPAPVLRDAGVGEAVRSGSTKESWPNIVKGYQHLPIYFPIPDKIPDGWHVIVTFGCKRGATASIYPDGSITDNYPDKALVDATNVANIEITDVADEFPSLIEQKVETDNPTYPIFTLVLHFPTGVTDPKKLNGVLAMCLPVGTVDDLRKSLADPSKIKGGNYSELFHYAQDRHLAVLAWGAPFVWPSYKSFDDLSSKELADRDADFQKLAKAWDTGVQKFVDEVEIPSNNYLMYGNSNGAGWVHRLALAIPNRFLAVQFHVCETFTAPTPEGSHILWLATTGELDSGCQKTRIFYKAARALGYPIIFKAVEGLHHSESKQAYLLGEHFFDYALKLRDQSLANVPFGQSPTLDLKDFASSPYYGDLMNQVMYPPNQRDRIPPGFLVPLPTSDIALVWNQ